MATATRPTRPSKKKRTVVQNGPDPKLIARLEQITARLNRARAKEQAIRDEQIDAIFEAKNDGWSLRQIADACGVTNPRIHATIQRYSED